MTIKNKEATFWDPSARGYPRENRLGRGPQSRAWGSDLCGVRVVLPAGWQRVHWPAQVGAALCFPGQKEVTFQSVSGEQTVGHHG